MNLGLARLYSSNDFRWFLQRRLPDDLLQPWCICSLLKNILPLTMFPRPCLLAYHPPLQSLVPPKPSPSAAAFQFPKCFATRLD